MVERLSPVWVVNEDLAIEPASCTSLRTAERLCRRIASRVLPSEPTSDAFTSDTPKSNFCKHKQQIPDFAKSRKTSVSKLVSAHIIRSKWLEIASVGRVFKGVRLLAQQMFSLIFVFVTQK
jgi:hypothetical protein